ncbi:hypothetical protein DPSP01_014184 [Paraphaeosphaeria sporulosa]
MPGWLWEVFVVPQTRSQGYPKTGPVAGTPDTRARAQSSETAAVGTGTVVRRLSTVVPAATPSLGLAAWWVVLEALQQLHGPIYFFAGAFCLDEAHYFFDACSVFLLNKVHYFVNTRSVFILEKMHHFLNSLPAVVDWVIVFISSLFVILSIFLAK